MAGIERLGSCKAIVVSIVVLDEGVGHILADVDACRGNRECND